MSDTRIKVNFTLKKQPVKVTVEKVNKILQGDNNFIKAKIVTHKDNDYVVFGIEHHSQIYPCIVDSENYHKIINNKFHLRSGYPSYEYGPRRLVKYMHNIVMNNDVHTGKGSELTLDHLNRICTDNRKCNLVMKTQKEQNLNQSKRKRRTKLPKGCTINPDDIPTHINYRNERGGYFSVEIKRNGKKVVSQATSKSPKYSLEEKLLQAKHILKKIMLEKPELFVGTSMNGDLVGEGLNTHNSYFDIIELAGFTHPDIQRNTVQLTDKLLDTGNTVFKGLKTTPDGFDKLPMYIRYVKPTKTRGEGFTYERRYEDGKRVTISSTRSSSVELKDKYSDLMKKLRTKGVELSA